MNNIVPYLCSNLNAWGALGPNTYPRVINTTTQKIPPIVEYIWNLLASIREIPEKYPSICLTPGKKYAITITIFPNLLKNSAAFVILYGVSPIYEPYLSTALVPNLLPTS